MHVHEFIRERGNIKKEVNVKPIKDLIKIFGKAPGYIQNSIATKPKVMPQMHPTQNRLLTNKEIQDTKDEYKMMKLYP
jgi:hypothetical protein